MSDLSTYLRGVLGEQGLSIAAFARKCGLTFETARRAVKGLAVPAPETLARIAPHVPASLTELRRLAGLAGQTPRPVVLPPASARLNDARRRLLVTIVMELVAAQDAEDAKDAKGRVANQDGGDAPVARLHPADAPPHGWVTRAARQRPFDAD